MWPFKKKPDNRPVPIEVLRRRLQLTGLPVTRVLHALPTPRLHLIGTWEIVNHDMHDGCSVEQRPWRTQKYWLCVCTTILESSKKPEWMEMLEFCVNCGVIDWSKSRVRDDRIPICRYGNIYDFLDDVEREAGQSPSPGEIAALQARAINLEQQLQAIRARLGRSVQTPFRGSLSAPPSDDCVQMPALVGANKGGE